MARAVTVVTWQPLLHCHLWGRTPANRSAMKVGDRVRVPWGLQEWVDTVVMGPGGTATLDTFAKLASRNVIVNPYYRGVRG